MPLPLVHRHPLESRLSQRSAIRAIDHLDVVRSAAIATVLGGEGDRAAVQRAAGEGLVRFVGPGEWLVVARETFPDMLLATLSSALPESVFVCDQSEARSLLRLSGPNARRILAKGVAVDLHPAAFKIGASFMLLCGHIAVNLARTGEHVFELVVTRSFAQSLYDDLMVMGREFDLSSGFHH